MDEPILEPGRRIVDPHHHLWDRRNDDKYMLDDLLADTSSGHNIVKTVFVECLSMYRADGPEEMNCVGETEFVQGVAAMSASGRYGATRVAAGIVSRADLCHPNAAQVLEAHVAASPNRFRGVRDAAAWDSSPEVPNSHTNAPEHLFLLDDFRRGFAHLRRLGLSFEAWRYHSQIPELTDLARAFPDTTIILNHFGGPLGIGPYAGRQKEVFEEWKGLIDELATCPNVVAKLGGVNMPRNGLWASDRAAPPDSEEIVATTKHYYEHTIDRFGPARCMFESNFPVDKAHVGYAELWNAFKKMAGGFREDEKDAMFHGTATRVYRLE